MHKRRARESRGNHRALLTFSRGLSLTTPTLHIFLRTQRNNVATQQDCFVGRRSWGQSRRGKLSLAFLSYVAYVSVGFRSKERGDILACPTRFQLCFRSIRPCQLIESVTREDSISRSTVKVFQVESLEIQQKNFLPAKISSNDKQCISFKSKTKILSLVKI